MLLTLCGTDVTIEIRSQIMDQLIKAGTTVDTVLLHDLICRGHHARFCKLFVPANVDLNDTSEVKHGCLLHAAIAVESMNIVQMLLDAGARVDLNCGQCGSAIGTAIAYRSHQILRLLMTRGADVNIPIPLTVHPLPCGPPIVAALSDRHLEGTDVIEALLEAGANIDATGPQGSALSKAVETGNIEIIRFLLRFNANTKVVVPNQQSPLEIAAYRGDVDAVSALIEGGADINHTSGVSDSHGSPLGEAVAEGELEVVRYLIEKGADVTIVCPTCGLHVPAVRAKMSSKRAKKDWGAILKLLLDAGASEKVPRKSKRKKVASRIEATQEHVNAN